MPIVSIYRWTMLLAISGLMILPSCKEGPEIKEESLSGRWEIYSATRNGNETPYLRGGYFIFDTKGVLTVNITGKDESSPYHLEQNVIVLEDKENYTITSMRKDSIDIHYIMNPESEFMFFLKKTSNEKH